MGNYYEHYKVKAITSKVALIKHAALRLSYGKPVCQRNQSNPLSAHAGYMVVACLYNILRGMMMPNETN